MTNVANDPVEGIIANHLSGEVLGRGLQVHPLQPQGTVGEQAVVIGLDLAARSVVISALDTGDGLVLDPLVHDDDPEFVVRLDGGHHLVGAELDQLSDVAVESGDAVVAVHLVVLGTDVVLGGGEGGE